MLETLKRFWERYRDMRAINVPALEAAWVAIGRQVPMAYERWRLRTLPDETHVALACHLVGRVKGSMIERDPYSALELDRAAQETRERLAETVPEMPSLEEALARVVLWRLYDIKDPSQAQLQAAVDRCRDDQDLAIWIANSYRFASAPGWEVRTLRRRRILLPQAKTA